MNTILWVFLAAALGMMMFSSLQEHLPPELAFLKSEPTQEQLGFDGSEKVTEYMGWRIRQAEDAVELFRSFQGRLELAGVEYNAPTIGILCSKGRLDIKISTQQPTIGSPTEVLVEEVSSFWVKGSADNIFPPSPQVMLAVLVKPQGTLPVSINYKNHGHTRILLDTRGLWPLVSQFPHSCKPT